MDVQDRVLKQISIRISEYVNGDIVLNRNEAINFMEQPKHVYSREEFSDDETKFSNLLAYYVLVNKQDSLGKLYLVSNNLEKCFWKLFIEIKKFVPRIDKNAPAMNTLAKWVVAKIYSHELFHSKIDLLRQREGARPYNFDDSTLCEREEALAVVYSYRLLHEYLQDNDYPDLWDWFIKKAFRYTSPGFKDWFIYLDDELFRSTLLDITGLPDHADLSSMEASATENLQSISGLGGRIDECVNDQIGNHSMEMGRFVKITELFTSKDELYLMWLRTFKWRQADILSFLINLPLNGFSIHIGVTDGDISKNWNDWVHEHTDSADKRVIVDMPQGVSRENLYFLLDGEQRFVVLFLLFFIKAIKDGNLNQLFISNGSPKLTLISSDENAFLNELLGFLQHGGCTHAALNFTKKFA